MVANLFISRTKNLIGSVVLNIYEIRKNFEKLKQQKVKYVDF